MPNAGKGLSGEVKDGVIYIYDRTEDEALKTLRHEFIDYLITSRIVKPLVSLINLLIEAREAEIYREKERLVDRLTRGLV